MYLQARDVEYLQSALMLCCLCYKKQVLCDQSKQRHATTRYVTSRLQNVILDESANIYRNYNYNELQPSPECYEYVDG